MILLHGLPLDLEAIEASIHRALGSLMIEPGLQNLSLSDLQPDQEAARHFRCSLRELHDRRSLAAITHDLLACAIGIRVADDRLNKKMLKALHPSSIEVYPQGSASLPTMRDACDKIIHAEDVQWLSNNDTNNIWDWPLYDETGAFRAPAIELYGSKNNKKWRARIKLIKFLDNAARVVSLCRKIQAEEIKKFQDLLTYIRSHNNSTGSVS